MKSLRLTGKPDPADAPAVFRLVADSPHVREARLVGWNLADPTLLFALDGDADGFREALAEAEEPPVTAAATAAVRDGHFVLLLRLDPDPSGLLGTMLSSLRRSGLVVVKPVVYRDGEVHARVVGETAVIQTFVEAFPARMDVSIHEVGHGGLDPTAPAATLSPRQREAVLAALELGYYETPKRATHDDLARELDCAPSTASEHLQRAEAKLIRATMQAYG